MLKVNLAKKGGGGRVGGRKVLFRSLRFYLIVWVFFKDFAHTRAELAYSKQEKQSNQDDDDDPFSSGPDYFGGDDLLHKKYSIFYVTIYLFNSYRLF